MSGKLTVLVGVPGAGKSTEATRIKLEDPDAIILRFDVLRHHRDRVGDPTRWAEMMVRKGAEALADGLHVVVDAPNLHRTHRAQWHRIAQVSGATTELVLVSPASAAVANARQDYRHQRGEIHVPRSHMARYWRQWQNAKASIKTEPWPNQRVVRT